MKKTWVSFAAAVTVAQLFAAAVGAQVPAGRPDPAPTNNPARQAPPPMPTLKSPVDTFRDLLELSPEGRKQALVDRSPEVRRQILAKLREYEILKPDQRELRLKVTELRWYLLPLLHATSATNRDAQLAAIPAEDRKLVEDRLRDWDKLPAATQAALLTNVMTIRMLTETGEQAALTNTNLSKERREFLERGIRQWQALSEEERGSIKARFDQVFSLTPAEKARVLGTLSATERDQIQKTLKRFGYLPPAQRAQCIENFEKFANLNLEERQQFLRNADRWNQMTPNERQAWRDLVRQLQPMPPLPPGFPGQPPLPPTRTPKQHRLGH